MLGKLLKYELKSTARIFLPFYAAVLVLSVLNRVLFVILENVEFLQIPRFLVMATYVFIIIATFIMTYIVMIQRFYKNLLGEEGYLSMTLPVKTSSHILSKGISSAIWILSTIIITLISIFIMLPNYDFLTQFSTFWAGASAEFRELLGLNFELLFTAIILITFVAIITSILMIYTAISFGQLSNKHKVLTSFGAYVAIYAIVQTIGASFLGILSSTSLFNHMEINVLTTPPETISKFVLGTLIGVMVIEIVLCVAYFFVTRYLLDKKLNLE